MSELHPTDPKPFEGGAQTTPRPTPPLDTAVIDPLLGVALGGRYLLRECLGTRGQFRIYSAEVETARRCLVTLAKAEDDPQAIARFKSLAERLSLLEHPCCAPIRDFGHTTEGVSYTHGVLYLVEEGETWRQLSQELAVKSRLPAVLALELGAQLFEGLDYLHGQGIVHGQLCSAGLRLLFDADGSQRLQITLSELPCRAVEAAEGLRGHELSADLRGGAAILVEMLTGRACGQQLDEEQVQSLEGIGLGSEQIAQLTVILRRAMGMGGEEYGTAGALLRDLQALIGHGRFGRYSLLRQIAQGGMGEIYLARAEEIDGIDIDRLCVIKTIRTSLGNDPQFVERFLAEARVLASLSHGNIVPVYDVGRVGTTFYIAMEYVAGKDLRAILSRAHALGRRLPVPLALFIARELANGLAYAHRAKVQGIGGLVHRDVSPHNLLVSYDGEVRLIDFGLVQAAQGESDATEGLVVGKLCYLSPEQAQAQPVDQRTDIYAAGLVLFELLTGEPFFNQEHVEQVLAQVAHPTLEPPSARAPGLPPEIDRICLRAMALRREERYSSAAELRDDLAAELARIAPRTNPEEVGAFVRELFATELAEERRAVMDLSMTLPPPGTEITGFGWPPTALGEGSGLSLRHCTPAPIHLASTLPGQAANVASPPVAVQHGLLSTPSVAPLSFPRRGSAAPWVLAISFVAVVSAALVALLWPRPPVAQRQEPAVPVLEEPAVGVGPTRPHRAPRPRTCVLRVQGDARVQRKLRGAQLLVNGEERATLPLEKPLPLQPGVPLQFEIKKAGMEAYRMRLRPCQPGEIVEWTLHAAAR